uniref:Uncharacterized protein n=1 Tax=Arundo donax TaxID=35708 RepID=A0A0A9C2E7_ARUDO
MRDASTLADNLHFLKESHR